MAKKILGISFGRKMSNCDIMVKHALMACEQAGCETAFLRADDLNITNCNGCIACTIGLMTGRGRGYCVRHDDFDILDECVMQSDAVCKALDQFDLFERVGCQVRLQPVQTVLLQIIDRALEHIFGADPFDDADCHDVVPPLTVDYSLTYAAIYDIK